MGKIMSSELSCMRKGLVEEQVKISVFSAQTLGMHDREKISELVKEAWSSNHFIFSPDEIERLRKEMGKKTETTVEIKETDSGNESSGSASPSTPEKDIGMKFTESSDSLLNGDITSASLNQPVAVGGVEWC